MNQICACNIYDWSLCCDTRSFTDVSHRTRFCFRFYFLHSDTDCCRYGHYADYTDHYRTLLNILRLSTPDTVALSVRPITVSIQNKQLDKLDLNQTAAANRSRSRSDHASLVARTCWPLRWPPRPRRTVDVCSALSGQSVEFKLSVWAHVFFSCEGRMKFVKTSVRKSVMLPMGAASYLSERRSVVLETA